MATPAKRDKVRFLRFSSLQREGILGIKHLSKQAVDKA